MRILFVLLNRGYVRQYESTLRLLADRGHTIHLALTDADKQADDPLVDRLAAEVPCISFGLAPARGDRWNAVAWAVRGTIDVLRYLDPRYAGAPALRQRALAWGAGLLGPFGSLFRALTVPALRTVAGSRALRRALRALERLIPSSRRIERAIRVGRYDLVLVTPLVNMGSPQTDWLKSARALGVPSALCVHSWDNLTNKGLIKGDPDRVIVWNATQQREAVDLHDVPPERVVVTGAQGFDEWFERQPSTSRDAFCARVGLRADRPLILYVCSSPFIARHEVSFVRGWLDALRASPVEDVAGAGVLVRPHPQHAEQWRDVDLGSVGNVTIWPRGGAYPIDEPSKAAYFDSLYHSAAVVGLNTSALIEAAIVGRPVLTILAPEFAATQTGTLHFQYLRRENGGPLQVADSLHDHVRQLGQALRDASVDRPKNEQFLRTFVRPHGLDVACTPIVAAAIERLVHQPAGARDDSIVTAKA